MAAYLANQTVAWQIPPGRIANFYQRGVYLSLPGWVVTNRPDPEVTCHKISRKKKKVDVTTAAFIS